MERSAGEGSAGTAVSQSWQIVGADHTTKGSATRFFTNAKSAVSGLVSPPLPRRSGVDATRGAFEAECATPDPQGQRRGGVRLAPPAHGRWIGGRKKADRQRNPRDRLRGIPVPPSRVSERCENPDAPDPSKNADKSRFLRKRDKSVDNVGN